ncbi:MAG: FG-GAP repeat protein [Planctomycetes bacterium]|nr:FG-GAP repeat protein [Planctomycetota bacterium]
MTETNFVNLPPQRNLRTLAAAAGGALLGLLATACSGGGGGGTGTVTPPLDQGSYTIDEFTPPPPRPAGFQPLGHDGFQALSRDELFVIAPTADAEGRIARLQDDPAASQTQFDLVALFAGEGPIHASAFGQLDADADDEMVVATVDASETRIDLHVVQRAPGGGPLMRTWFRSLPAKPWNFEDVRVVLADVDGDFRDEVLVAARANSYGNATDGGAVWVLDDPEAGPELLLEYDRNARHISIDPLPVDVDGDGVFEVAIGLGGDATDDGRYAVRLYDYDAASRTMVNVHGWKYLWSSSVFDSSRAVAGDFDGDGDTDLALIGTRSQSGQRIVDMRLHEFVDTGTAQSWPEFAQFSSIDVSGPSGFGYGDYAATALHVARGGDDLVVGQFGGSDYTCDRMHYDRGTGTWNPFGLAFTNVYADQTISLCATDIDADGYEELQIALLAYPSSGARLDLATFDYETHTMAWQPSIALGNGGANSRFRLPLLAAGDFDADGLAVQFTGRTELKLGDPVPLVVLGAPPTKDGISQNYDNTESAYSTGTTQGQTIGVSTYSSITTSASAGATLFGVLGVEGRASFERGIERTHTDTRQETVVRGYRGSFDKDVIVFQGTLYETYEYVIVGAPDPSLLGTLLTLDLPVGANTYKWTVAYYNDRVAAEDRIGTDLLTHTPGDVASYPTRGELDALIGSDQHWDMPGSRPVGQGTASDFESVSFETVHATEQQRTISRSYGGGASFGVSVSVDATTAEGSTHGVFYGSETSFEASVGDIADIGDYTRWNYSWGFAIQTVGRNGGPGNPTYGSRKHSFQYLRFWVDPQGSAY